jgi:hypothetical protein
MPTVLDLVGGSLWAAVYVLLIKRGFQDRACGMPVLVLCINFGWEILALTLRPVPEITPTAYLCVPLDAVIFVQCFLYGPADFRERPLVRRFFRPMLLVTVAYVTAVVFLFETRIHDDYRYYSAYLDNLTMSGLFIAMLLRRGNVRGQSMYIALGKMLGTGLISLELLRTHRDPQPALLALLAAGSFVLDAVYTGMLYAKLREERIPPWTRF